MKIGFIGLGNMGAPMASNLARAGYHVAGFDVAAVTVPEVAAVKTIAEVARGVDILITMLPGGEILRDVAGEVIPFLDRGAVFVDCSTVDVESARAVAKQCEQSGVFPLDAPVSGGIRGAELGTLTFMVGGSEEAFRKLQPEFDIMGNKAVYCGASGSGQGAKICNNMILGINMIGTCEAFALARRLGLDAQKLFDVVSTSSGYSWVSNVYCPIPGVGPQSPADNHYAPGFAAELMLKDLRLAQMSAQSVAADTPLGELACQLYEAFVEQEDGRGRDFSAMLPRFNKRTRGQTRPSEKNQC